MATEYVGAIDQGTTSTRFVVFDNGGRPQATARRRHEQYYPRPGWVEHDPREIAADARAVIREGLQTAGIDGDALAAIGITNQRETTVVWERATGKPLAPAIVWQDRRTADRIDALPAATADSLRDTTGLEPDAYFSASKLEWLLNNAAGEPTNAREPGIDPTDHGGVDPTGHDRTRDTGRDTVHPETTIRHRARRGEVAVGTIDSWLCYTLADSEPSDDTRATHAETTDDTDATHAETTDDTDGTRAETTDDTDGTRAEASDETDHPPHVTDATNASRTMLYDIDAEQWDTDALATFGVPEACLPTVRPSVPARPYGYTTPSGPVGARVPITAALGDQQAALFGQTCFDPGATKATYGTGTFVLMHTGTDSVRSDHGLVGTIAVSEAGEPTEYALEGSVFTTGAVVEWLADTGVIPDPGAVERLAGTVDSTDGVYLVPAFSGLGAPYWDGQARGTIVGLTRGTEPAHIARATLEAIAYRTRDVTDAMVADAGRDLRTLRVDGGAAANDTLCAIQAGVLDEPVRRAAVQETTALGAAFAAGLAVGVWPDRDALRECWAADRTVSPDATDADWPHRYERWGEAVERSRDWARE